MQNKETELVERLKSSGDKESAFRELIKESGELLYKIVRKQVNNHADADDILQNTYVKVFKGIKNFKGNSKLMTWMTAIALNETRSYIMKNKRFIASPEIPDSGALNPDTPEEIHASLVLAIESLPDRQKEIFIMRYFQELPYSDICHSLNISTGSAKASYHHAVAKVKNYIIENSLYAE